MPVVTLGNGKGGPAYDINRIFYFALQMKQQLSNMEFGRRLAVEKELEKADAFHLCNICT